MGAGFIRRFGSFPGTEQITAIEGAIIIDSPPPGAVQGVGTGTVAVIGEYQDMGRAVAVDGASGAITTKPQPVELFTAQDMANKVGGFDPTIGDFGLSMGNAFVGIRNNVFSRLIAVPVNLCSDKGVRIFRQLPTCKGLTDPTPIVPMAAAVVAAGTEFKSGNNRLRAGTLVAFTSDDAYFTSVNGALANAGGVAATQILTDLTADFGALGVVKGDVVVIGVIGGAAGLGANARTMRVAATPALGATTLSLERLDGVTFDWTTIAAIPYRIHVGKTADSNGTGAMGDQFSFSVPARPLDATIGINSVLSPTVAPAAGTATTWDPLSGLGAANKAAVTYTAGVQAPNAVTAAAIDALYQTAADSLLTDDLPAREVNIVVAARASDTINSMLKKHVLTASAQGLGRMAVISPILSAQSTDTVVADGAPGVGANRDERVVYAWPGFLQSIGEAVNVSIKGADGKKYTNGQVDCLQSIQLSSLLSVLAPERNPGQAADPVPLAMSNVIAFQRGVSGLAQPNYKVFRSRGICAMRIDKDSGPLYQSGITTSLESGRKNINRRRMADFIEDSLAQRYNQFAKLPLTVSLKDAVVGETDAFLSELLSVDNPAAQRISAYQVDAVGGNTPELEAQGIYVVIVRVRTLATADFIVLQAEIGEGVTISQVA